MNMFKPVAAKNVDEYIAMQEKQRGEDLKKLDRFIKETVPKLHPYFVYNMIGYGTFHYKSKSGREGDWPIISLASQKNYISLYVCSTKNGKYLPEYYKKLLPKASIGKSCIRFKRLEDVDLRIVSKILKEASKNPGF